jgi:hypothetical protein
MLFKCGVRLAVRGVNTRHCEGEARSNLKKEIASSPAASRNDNCGTPSLIANRKPLIAAFTFIEILIALVVIAVLFIPMIQLFSNAIYAVTVSGEGITAVNLARWEMEKVRNLNVTKLGLKKIGDLWTPNLDEPPLEINQAKWRILRRVDLESDPLMIKVEVYREDNLKKPMASVATLVEDSIWI